jgi:hypothetical protein
LFLGVVFFKFVEKTANRRGIWPSHNKAGLAGQFSESRSCGSRNIIFQCSLGTSSYPNFLLLEAGACLRGVYFACSIDTKLHLLL